MGTWHKTVGSLMIGLGLLLAGCAGAGNGRPIMALDGQAIDFSDPVEKGRALILTAQYGLAVEALQQAASRDPHNARTLTLLAVAYGELKRFDLADRYHAEALQIDANSVAALNNWGYSYLVRGDRLRAADLLARAAADGEIRPIVAANLMLARGGGEPAPPLAAAPVDDPMRSIQVSRHVTLVRPAGRLVRVAPGVQMLLTAVTVQAPQRNSLSDAAPPPLAPASSGATSPEPFTDTRFALFRALFDLMEREEDSSVAAAGQIADASARPSPFGFFPDVDDFTN